MDKKLKDFLADMQRTAETGLPLALATLVFHLRGTMRELKKTLKDEGKDFNIELHIEILEKSKSQAVLVTCYDPDIGIENFRFKSVVQIYDAQDETGDVAVAFSKLSEAKHGQSTIYRRYCVDINGPKVSNERALLWDLAHGMERESMADLPSNVIMFLLEDVLPE